MSACSYGTENGPTALRLRPRVCVCVCVESASTRVGSVDAPAFSFLCFRCNACCEAVPKGTLEPLYLSLSFFFFSSENRVIILVPETRVRDTEAERGSRSRKIASL